MNWIRAGAFSGAAAVAMGAFGAHALKNRLGAENSLLKTWDTASHYHLMHALALVCAGQKNRKLSSLCFGLGTLMFSGSLYALVLTEDKRLGAITPIGGTLLIAGWLAFGLGR